MTKCHSIFLRTTYVLDCGALKLKKAEADYMARINRAIDIFQNIVQREEAKARKQLQKAMFELPYCRYIRLARMYSSIFQPNEEKMMEE